MKFFNLIPALLCGLLFASCDYDSFEEEDALGGLFIANQYVRLITGGADGTLEATVGEGDTTTSVVIENQFIEEEDITVEYALSGTATYGEIYTIEGASSSGGSFTIEFENEDPEDTTPARETVQIDYLVDTLMTAPQTIVFDLISATDDAGNDVAVGQGPLRKTLTITLVND